VFPIAGFSRLAVKRRELNVDILIHGGTHRADAAESQGCFYLDPGSATGAFTATDAAPVPSFILLNVQGTTAVAYIYTLGEEARSASRRRSSRRRRSKPTNCDRRSRKRSCADRATRDIGGCIGPKMRSSLIPLAKLPRRTAGHNNFDFDVVQMVGRGGVIRRRFMSSVEINDNEKIRANHFDTSVDKIIVRGRDYCPALKSDS
jgi:hypothetical protein